MLDLILSVIPGGGLTAIFGAVGVLLLAAWRLIAHGRKLERSDNDRARIEAMNEAQKIDQAVAGNDPDANREELRKWSR